MLLAYVNSCFIIIRQNLFPVSISSRISKNFGTTASATIFPLQEQTSGMRSKMLPNVL